MWEQIRYCGQLQHTVFNAAPKETPNRVEWIIGREIARPLVYRHIVSGQYWTIVSNFAWCVESAIYCFLLHFPLPARFLNSGVRGLMSFCSCLHLFTTTVFPSVKCLRRALLGKTWRIHLPFLRSILCRMMMPYSMTEYFIFHTIGQTDLPNSFPAPHFKTIKILIIYSQKCSKALGMGKGNNRTWEIDRIQSSEWTVTDRWQRVSSGQLLSGWHSLTALRTSDLNGLCKTF
jgi:hypothetical protein